MFPGIGNWNYVRHHAIAGYSLFSINSLASDWEARHLCKNTSGCLSVEYNASVRRYGLNYITRLEAGNEWEDNMNSTFYDIFYAARGKLIKIKLPQEDPLLSFQILNPFESLSGYKMEITA